MKTRKGYHNSGWHDC